MALPREALDEIAKAGTGANISAVPPSTLSRAVGNVTVNRYTGQPTGVAVSSALNSSQYEKVAAHEIGHVIDQASGELPTDGVMNELKGVYTAITAVSFAPS
ncbi:MAG: hypothetical protein KGL46_05890 [Hyphomicrobiales bacterium]|nr:hypothetical protein [Hyphomicrobiales bacterium]